ncbi:hypothetical protein SSS_06417 [Sarcoptes scabiei]|uniref:Uncharacterized protein n=1 Tax=Sarcoptes scabiei TaxID=52283 RepID=A0A834RK63_SARSC|nr:hypothetical protein SSS_06417 [Sarcoptes scabiei]
MSSGFSNIQLNAESMHPHRFVESFFSSIDLLIERLAFLRRNVPGPIPYEYLNYFQIIENKLEILKTFMIAMKNSVCHRVRGPLDLDHFEALVNDISNSLWEKVLLTQANHGALQDLSVHYREFRSECLRSHCARREFIHEIDVLGRIEIGLFATVSFYHRAFEQTYTWLFVFQRFADRVFQRELI